MDDHLCRRRRVGGLRQLLAGESRREVREMLGVKFSLECVPRHRARSGGRLGTGLNGPGGHRHTQYKNERKDRGCGSIPMWRYGDGDRLSKGRRADCRRTFTVESQSGEYGMKRPVGHWVSQSVGGQVSRVAVAPQHLRWRAVLAYSWGIWCTRAQEWHGHRPIISLALPWACCSDIPLPLVDGLYMLHDARASRP